MSTIVEAAAANSLTILADQFFRKLYQKYALPMRMRRDLRGSGSADSESVLLTALQKAFGNHGTLTEATNRALLDIANSGLLDQLISLMASDLGRSDAKELVSYIHLSRGSDNDTASIQFAEDLLTSLQTAFEHYNSNALGQVPPVMRGRRRRTLGDSAKRAATVISSLVNSLKDKDGNWLKEEEFSTTKIAERIDHHLDPLFAYVQSTIQTLNSVDVHGASGDVVQVELDDIYVDVPVNSIPRHGNFVNYQDLRRQLHRDEIANTWQDTLDHVSKTVLLGDPGGGKSTLSKKLCYERAKQFLNGHPTLPIFIQLRTYIAKAVDDDNLSLAHYMLDHVRSAILDKDDGSLQTIVLYHLRIGTVFVVADGLDEVLTPSNRARVVQEILKFSKEFPLATLLVTSRYVGYENHPLNQFTHLGVDHLNNNAIEAIYQNVSRCVLQRTTSEIQEKKEAFLTDARRKAEELIGNPLLLTLIVIIYNNKSEIPDNRAALYSFCADLLFERWDEYRKITPELPERFRLFDLFKYLSSILYEREEYGGRINKEDLLEEARKFFRRDYIDNKEGKSATAAHHMVEHLTGRAWILHEVGENVFEFTHRTFMEFFYARHLETEYESTEDLVNECLRHVTVGSRTVSAHLALQIRTKDKRAASSRVCMVLVETLQDEENNAELLDFCLDALGYLLPDGASISALVRILAPRALQSEGPSEQIRLLCTANPLRNTILQNALPSLQRISTVNAVRKLVPALFQLHRDERDIVELVDGTSISMIELIVDQTYSKQSSSPFLNKLAFDLDARTNWRALAKFGFRIWWNGHTAGFPQIVGDSRRMIVEASKVISDEAYIGNRFYQLAQVLNDNVSAYDSNDQPGYFVAHRVRFGRTSRELKINLDPRGWRKDRSALEIFSVCLALFIEVHSDAIARAEMKKFGDALAHLIEALNQVGSPKATWLKAWVAGEITIIVDPRHGGRRENIFLEMSAREINLD